MKKLMDLRDLLNEQLKELHSAEQQQKEMLQKYIKKTEAEDLKFLIQKIASETDQQSKRIDEALQMVGETKRVVECKAMQELLNRGLQLVKMCENKNVNDAALIVV